MTAMKAAANPKMADAETKPRIRKKGRVDMNRIFLWAEGLGAESACV
jgi:hypothetical protein